MLSSVPRDNSLPECVRTTAEYLYFRTVVMSTIAMPSFITLLYRFCDFNAVYNATTYLLTYSVYYARN